jgi:DNA-binding transcriptional LysR family regulator
METDARILGGIATLSAVVESGSFVKAANALGVTQSAVSRAIGKLEVRIGIRLFHRTTRTVKLTAEGRQFYEEIAPLLDGIENAVTSASGTGTSVKGHLRVNIDPLFSRLLVAPHIGKFLDRYSELSLELVTRSLPGDLVSEGFDIGIRFGDPAPSSLVIRKLLDTRILTVAAPGYIERFGRPSSPVGLSRHNCLQFRNSATGQPYEWEFHRGRKVVRVKTDSRLMLTDAGSLLATCLAGVGIAQVMNLEIQPRLDSGELIDLFPDWPDETFPLYMLYPSRTLPPAKLRAFIDFMQTVIGQCSGVSGNT